MVFVPDKDSTFIFFNALHRLGVFKPVPVVIYR